VIEQNVQKQCPVLTVEVASALVYTFHHSSIFPEEWPGQAMLLDMDMYLPIFTFPQLSMPKARHGAMK
jgi:hypothetical protein